MQLSYVDRKEQLVWDCFSESEAVGKQSGSVIEFPKSTVEAIGIPDDVFIVFNQEEVKNLRQQYGYWILECWQYQLHHNLEL
jgi:hypothetical protein